jgi:hypothetical protein
MILVVRARREYPYVKTASDVAPAARAILDRLADVAADDVIGLNAASRLTDIWPGALRAAIEDGRLDATFGRVAPTANVAGNPNRWQIRGSALRAFIASCPECSREGCDKLAIDATGYCRVHARAERQRGVRRPGIGPKISAARSGRSFGPHTSERRAAISRGHRRFWRSAASEDERRRRAAQARDPEWQFKRILARWLPAKTVSRMIVLYERRFGNAPPRTLVGSWSFMRGGGRPTLAAVDPEFARKADEVRRLRQSHPAWGARTIAKEVGLSRWKVRELLARPDAS